MSKSLVYVVLLTLFAASSFAAAFMMTVEPPTEGKGAPMQPATTAATVIEHLREGAQEVTSNQLERIVRSAPIQRYLNPALARQPEHPVLTPGRPPQRKKNTATVSKSALEAEALSSLTALAGEQGLAFLTKGEDIALCSGKHEIATQLWTNPKPSKTHSRSGVVQVEETLYEVSIRHLGDGNTALVYATPLTIDALKAYQSALGSIDISLVQKGALELTTIESEPLKKSATDAASALRSNEALQSPGETFSAVGNLDDLSVQHARALLVSPTGNPVAALLVTSHAKAASSQKGLAQLKSAPQILDPMTYVRFWATLILITVVLLVLGALAIRAERKGAFGKASRALNSAYRLDDAKLSNEAMSFIEQVKDFLPAAETKEKSKPNKDEHLLKSIRFDLEASESKLKQTSTQLEYARKENTRLQKELEEKETLLEEGTEDKENNEELEDLKEALTVSQEEIKGLRAHIEMLEAEMLDSELLEPQPEPSHEEVTSIKPAPLPEDEDEDFEEDEDVTKIREFDTAEVSGEEISQLLEGIDPGAPASEESLDELAESIGAMSAAQLSMLEAEAPKLIPKEDLQPKPRATNTNDKDTAEVVPSARTARLWQVPSDHAAKRLELGRQTLPGGLRVREVLDGVQTPEDEEPKTHVTAPPPWKAGAEPNQALSPSNLLEALKKRGQGELDGDESENTHVSPLSSNLFDSSPRQEEPKRRSVSQSGTFTRTGSRANIDVENVSDSEYFKSLYQEFLDTKRRCGESTEKITVERFVSRLARNKQSLLERYGCRTVRFQVYVKNGKAALKATPVK